MKALEQPVKSLKAGISFLAEDNDLNAEIAEAILEHAGLKTERVEDGIQCVNKITKNAGGNI